MTSLRPHLDRLPRAPILRGVAADTMAPCLAAGSGPGCAPDRPGTTAAEVAAAATASAEAWRRGLLSSRPSAGDQP